MDLHTRRIQIATIIVAGLAVVLLTLPSEPTVELGERSGIGSAVRSFLVSVGLLGRDEARVVRCARSGLGLTRAQLVQLWTAELGSADPRARRSAASALGSYGPMAKAAAPALRNLLDDEDGGVRAAAAGALIGIEGEVEVPPQF